jgi:hypothetical protein
VKEEPVSPGSKVLSRWSDLFFLFGQAIDP